MVLGHLETSIVKVKMILDWLQLIQISNENINVLYFTF